MSVVIEAIYKGQIFDVEVFHDGHIEVPGSELECEQAMAEFKNSESVIMKFYHLWSEDWVDACFRYLLVPEEGAGLLAADYAEHVLDAYESVYPNNLYPRKAINAVREFACGKIRLSTLKKAGEAVRASWPGAVAAAAGAAARAADAAAGAAWAATKAATALRAVRSAAWDASQAAAYSAVQCSDMLEWDQAQNAESAWQLRRFVDCMEAIGQGFDWPPLEATP